MVSLLKKKKILAAMSGGGALSYQDTIVAALPLAYWPLDDSVGSPTAREVVAGKTGTLNAGVTAGQPGPSTSTTMAFNGTTGRILTAATVVVPLTVSVEAWINIASSNNGGYRTIFANRGAGGAGSFLSGLLTLVPVLYGDDSTPNQVTSGPGLSVSTWHHVVYVLTGTNTSVYVDGALAFTGAQSRPSPPATVISIGSDVDNANPWNGLISDVAIYPRALPLGEISAHFALRS